MKPRSFIAIVDDDESVRKAFVRLLRAAQLEAEGFSSGPAFLRSLAVRQPDCLVLDLHMPGLSGFDLQRQLAGTQMRFPIIIITAHDEPMLREHCLADGAVDYLRKPLRGGTLLRSIRTALEQNRANRHS